MEALGIAASIIAVMQLTSTLLEYLNSVKDAPKDRAQCAIDAANLHNLLTMLRYRLEESHCDEPWYNALGLLGIHDGPLDQYRQALEQLLEKISWGHASQKLVRSLVWSFRKEDVKDLLDRIGRLKSIISIALEMDHFKLSQAIKADIEGFQHELNEIRCDTKAILSTLPTVNEKLDGIGYAKHLSEVANWISSANSGPQHTDLIARKQEGTGAWFLDSPAFSAWLSGPNETLFCPGIPGAGKTMIAAIAVDHLLRTMQSDSIGMAFIYCNYKSDAGSSSALLSSILKQLLFRRASIPDDLNKLYLEHKKSGTSLSLGETCNAVLSVLATYSRTYIIIDALDECSDNNDARGQLIKNLRDLQSRTKSNLSLMFTSRFLPDIQSQFTAVPTLEIRATESDVTRFLEGQLHRLPKCVQRDQQLRSQVVANIAEAVAGMFLLARLYLDSLLDKRTKAKLLSALQKLGKGPDTLNDAYDGAVERIQSQLPEDKALANKVITWVVYSKRPLCADELLHALAVSVGDTKLDRDNILDAEDLISVCAGLVTLDEETGGIRLVHYTTQEYFEAIGEAWCPNAHGMLASTCLTYLLFDHFKSSDGLYEWVYVNDSASREIRSAKHYPFIQYAAEFWPHHTIPVQDKVSCILLPFLLDGKIVAEYAVLLYHLRPWSSSASWKDGVGTRWTGVHLASLLGFDVLLRRLLECADKSTIESELSAGHTPLQLAITGCRIGTIKVLLEHGADINFGSKHKPLSYAAELGFEHVVELLLESKEVDVNAVDQHIIESRLPALAPLHYAVTHHHSSIIELLLNDKRTDPNLRCLTVEGQPGLTALGLAIKKDDLAMVQLLLANRSVNHNI